MTDFVFRDIFHKPRIINSDKPRIQFIDLAKGFCILMVLVDHCGINTGIWANHLRMPLYFVLSGLFFKDYSSFTEFFRKKTNNILIPFIIFYFVGLVYGLIIDILCDNPLDIYRIGTPAFFHEGKMNNYALWFLLALFWTNLIYFGISRAFSKKWAKGAAVILIAMLSCKLNRENGMSILYFGSAIMSLPLFYFGQILKRSPMLYGASQNYNALMGGGYLAVNQPCNYGYI